MRNAMMLLKRAALLLLLLAALSCNRADAPVDQGETQTRVDSAGIKKAAKKKATWKFSEFEESIVSKVNALPVVQRKTREVDSLSNGDRQLLYRAGKAPGKPNVYTVTVSEDRNGTTVEHFVFEVDSVSGTIRNPDGRR